MRFFPAFVAERDCFRPDLPDFPPVCRLSCLPSYYIPDDGPLPSYLEYINGLPPTEHPEVFGQHFNADIASQIAEARMLFDTMLALQPQTSGAAAAGGGLTREDKVRSVALRSEISKRVFSDQSGRFLFIGASRCWGFWETSEE